MIKFLDLKKINASFQPALGEAVERVVNSGWYLFGNEVDSFEKIYNNYIGSYETIACANGLDALTLIIRAYIELGVMKPGDEIIVPANTYIASILAISENGLIPVLVDASSSTFQINPHLIEQAITPRTRAVMIVHLYGRNAWTPQISDLCRKHNLKLIEDNAQAAGCVTPDGRKTGSLGDAAGHSFYPGKNLGAIGDGGAVTTSDSALAQMVRTLAFYGSERKYIFDYCGRNSRMDEIQAAVLKVKLPRLDHDNIRRGEIAAIYREGIKNPLVCVPFTDLTPDSKECVFHLYPVLTDKREELQKYLADNQIQTQIHYPIPPHKQKCYSGSLPIRYPLPVTEMIHGSELSLPISSVMTDEEAKRVVDAINNFPG